MYATNQQFSFDLGDNLSTLPVNVPAVKKSFKPQHTAAAASVLQLGFDFEALAAMDDQDDSVQLPADLGDGVELGLNYEADDLDDLGLDDLEEGVELGRQSFYEYLTEANYIRKLTAICLRKANVPDHIKDDAELAILETWFRCSVKEGHVHNQICKYAYLAGKSAALQARRDLGYVVQLPRDAFSKKKSKAFEEFVKTIGAAAVPDDVEDYTDSVELSTADQYDERYPTATDVERRLAKLTLSPLHRAVATQACMYRRTAKEIAQDGVQVGNRHARVSAKRVREILQEVTQALYDLDDAVIH